MDEGRRTGQTFPADGIHPRTVVATGGRGQTPTANQGTTYRLGYRADIEGLRAIAILLVVACHAKVRWLAGGFVGVDVFYVLSGYLITGLLVQEISTTGGLRFATFYGRRLRRLLPSLLLMLTIICVSAWVLLPPAELPTQIATAGSAALWLSNFRFAFSNLGYFDPSAETNLFLHTWSLGVEEQFYLVWPLLMVLAMGAWKGAKRLPDPARLKWLFGGIFLASFTLSWYWTHASPHLAFYMMPARAWQFALGALVFLLVGSPSLTPSHTIIHPVWLRRASWLGLAMILLAALLIDGNTPYPGTWALVPSFGAALVLAARGQTVHEGTGRVLALRPMQAIGRISYGWYLWHWPLLLLGATLLDTRHGWSRLLLVVLSLLIAAVSYRWFETPIRHSRRLLAKPRMAVAVAVALMILVASLTQQWHVVAQQRARHAEQSPFEAARKDVPVIYSMGCDEYYHSARVLICSFGEPHAAHTAVAFGDSIDLQWFPAFRQIFDKPGWRLLVITKSACPMVDKPYFLTEIGREYIECSQWRNDALKTITTLHPDAVILGSTFTYRFTKDQWISGTSSVLRKLAGSARRIYLMRSTPMLPFDGPSCLAPRSRIYEMLTGTSRCAGNADTEQWNLVYQWLRAAAAPFHNVQLIDMTDSVCPGGVCHAELNGRVVFRDKKHLTASFVQSLAPILDKALSTTRTQEPATGNATTR